jgi:hypothetical protein
MARVDDKNKEKHDNLQEKVLHDIYEMFDIIEFIEKYNVASCTDIVIPRRPVP